MLLNLLEKNPEKRLERAKLKAVLTNYYLAYLFTIIDIHIVNSSTLAYTNGVDIYVSRKALSQLNEEQLAFVLLHEVAHILLDHVTRAKMLGEDRKQKIWNIATDLIINEILIKKLTAPLGIITIESFCDRLKILVNCEKLGRLVHYGTAEEVYEYLKRLPEIPSFPQDIRPDDQSSCDGQNEEDRERNLEKMKKLQEIKKEIQSGAYRGLDVGILKEILERFLKPKVNWKDYLKKKLTSTIEKITTWQTINRRKSSLYNFNVLYPGYKKKGRAEVVVSVDTSGSIDDKTLTQFISEVVAIAKEKATITVIFHDSKIQKIVENAEKNLEELKEVPGRGGTSHKEVLEYLYSLPTQKKRKTIVVILSDFYSDLEPKDVRALKRDFAEVLLFNEKLEPMDEEKLRRFI